MGDLDMIPVVLEDRHGREMTLQPGLFVWGLIKGKPWPGMIVHEDQVGLKPPRSEHKWVYWFGDYRVSQMKYRDILPYEYYFLKMYATRHRYSSVKWTGALVESIKEYSMDSMHPLTDQDMALDWALDGFHGSRKDTPFHPAYYSPLLMEKLDELKSKNSGMMRMEQKKTSMNRKLLQRIARNGMTLEEFCIACYDVTDRRKLSAHPLFMGSICGYCKEKLKVGYYVTGQDGISVYCTLCANVGKVYVCGNRCCNRVFCETCVEDFAGAYTATLIKVNENWRCFICNPDQVGLIILRENWKEGLNMLHYCPEQKSMVPAPDIPIVKSKLRVISLFDGIGTGMHVLNKLGIEVENYFSCEIDKDCLAIHEFRHPNIIQLGNILDIDEEKLKELGPIDLLIGGSPCNDLSIVNPNRRGLYDVEGSGYLFFHFYRILMILRAIGNKQFFWFYENVASMPTSAKEEISRFLQSEPRVIDAALMSGQRRARYFWGNLPTLRENLDIQDFEVSFQNHLNPGRVATVKKVRTVTTNPYSLRQAKKNMPIMDIVRNVEDVPTIEEIERCFGFNEGYTNLPNLTESKRLKLLGRAWSVPVIKFMLSFLSDYFSSKTED